MVDAAPWPPLPVSRRVMDDTGRIGARCAHSQELLSAARAPLPHGTSVTPRRKLSRRRGALRLGAAPRRSPGSRPSPRQSGTGAAACGEARRPCALGPRGTACRSTASTSTFSGCRRLTDLPSGRNAVEHILCVSGEVGPGPPEGAILRARDERLETRHRVADD